MSETNRLICKLAEGLLLAFVMRRMRGSVNPAS